MLQYQKICVMLAKKLSPVIQNFAMLPKNTELCYKKKLSHVTQKENT